MKLLYLITLIIQTKTFEKYSYNIIFEKTIKREIIYPYSIYSVKNNLKNWNAFCIRINSLNLNSSNSPEIVTLMVFKISGNSFSLKINSLEKKYYFGNKVIGEFLTDSNLEDFENLKSFSTNWKFFSLNSNSSKIKLFFDENIFEYFGTGFIFQEILFNIELRHVDEKVVYSHFHFFEINIPEEDMKKLNFILKI